MYAANYYTVPQESFPFSIRKATEAGFDGATRSDLSNTSSVCPHSQDRLNMATISLATHQRCQDAIDT